MKRFFSLFILLSLCFHVYGRFTAQCDVIYEKSVGEWSEFHRVKQTTHHHVIVEYLCSTYQECYNWMKQKYE